MSFVGYSDKSFTLLSESEYNSTTNILTLGISFNHVPNDVEYNSLKKLHKTLACV